MLKALRTGLTISLLAALVGCSASDDSAGLGSGAPAPAPGLDLPALPAAGDYSGQFAARRDAYRAVGGHGAVRKSRHDGVSLPRTFRRAGRSTDLFDATPVATCRMYRSAREVWDGFAKNAVEGMAAPTAIGPWTVLLGGGHVLPFLLLAAAPSGVLAPGTVAGAAVGVALVTTMRLMLAARFRQSVRGAVLHPVGVVVLLAIQYAALARAASGRRTAWKGRTQS